MYLATCKFTFFSFPNWFYKIAKCLVVKWIKCEYQRLTITEEQLWMNISCVVQVDMEILFPFWGWQRRGKAKPQTGCPRIYSNCEHCFGLGTSLKISPQKHHCVARGDGWWFPIVSSLAMEWRPRAPDAKWKVASLMLGQGTGLGCRLRPMFLSLPSLLSKNK